MSDESALPWLQLTLEADQYDAERLENALLQAGAIAVTLQDAGDQPAFEPLPGETPLWTHTQVTGLFAAQTDIETVKQSVRYALGADDVPVCRAEELKERDWVGAWLDHFQPMRFGRRLWICPTNQSPPQPTAVNLFLDPGLAFGSGTHPSTALCLDWLDGTALANKTVIDYGCGSGILAIAAAKLGAQRVWAVDIDPQALSACERNANANGVTDIVIPSTPATLPAIQVDILLANILAAPLIELAPRFGRWICRHGQLVLSGILVQQAEQVQAAFKSWFAFSALQQRQEWVLLEARRD